MSHGSPAGDLAEDILVQTIFALPTPCLGEVSLELLQQANRFFSLELYLQSLSESDHPFVQESDGKGIDSILFKIQVVGNPEVLEEAKILVTLIICEVKSNKGILEKGQMSHSGFKKELKVLQKESKKDS